ncbi:pantoate--beta-alanine ligase [Rathayibacter sp. VKM Ac-2759]|uniref:pantoate--beta-alanine ligase n=1 Tax=Rathayibacter sp. VKM Ac-2759 TaxID=2609252 RepID=UPI001318CBBD|nr:pantoate--beta-alanine ligase [Rathayibacter sp. VKM Ac-2759]QHC65626.1 pantoate--beta-alanine ligase [Rathayibacter sp. VKM Ac-2759]
MISTIERIDAVRERLRAERRAGRSIALVPTMGALHDGHLALVDRAREIADVVVVSIFVNPLQFGPSEDLDRYPRDLAADLALLEREGVEYVFAPTVAEMYPDGPSATRVVAGKAGTLYEGRSRPGHFDGMLTVVAKLLGIVQPDAALFGQKDAQQLFLVRRMVRDLDLPVVIEAVETVREEDGLALSSRNRYLDARERRAARTVPLVLEAAASAADRGVDSVIAAAQSAAMGEPLVKLDYLAVADPTTFLPVDDDYRGPALVLVAAVVGSTRLLDNGPILLA